MKGKDWREKIRKIILWRPDMRLVAVLATAALLLLLVPLCRIAIYSIPWYDDYDYGGFVKRALEQEYSLGSALRGAVECARVEWYAWQGTFSSIFFMALVPMVWGEEYYFLGPLFLIGILTAATWIFVMTLAKAVLSADWAPGAALAAGAAAMTVAMVYNPCEGFYWYNGGVHYVGMHSALLLLTAAWGCLLAGGGKLKSALLVVGTLLGAVCAGGSNYVTSLQGFLVGLSMAALGVLLRKKRTFLLLPSLLVYGYAFYQNAIAPGNQVRGAVFKEKGIGMDAASAIVKSFAEAVRFVGMFTWQMTLMAMLLLAPIIWGIVKKSRCRFRCPALVLAWSFCLYASGFTSSLYTMGSAGVGRIMNAVKLTYQILVLVNEVYWLGWACRRLEQRAVRKGRQEAGKENGRVKSVPFAFYLLMGGLMLAAFKTDWDPEGHYSPWAAYIRVHIGEANEFHKQYLERVEAIKSGGDVVTVEPYIYRPWILATWELAEDPASGANVAMARWYGKQAIICAPKEN